ncbi:gliding motility-associated C-terminal domain-containing protein [Marinilongibacter aquaticus]|uniref:T9SS type B sorting domain-containing protein n=1 Tax=Marinilongibacter aquaticus TaxID=2975157 RepID=UPI0021BD1765|nr:gliding motility-associated C-terminal domain-containing protein [Marinilongibacter aquaticus]UBM60457.1 gliding motility-associated C-terminal domain-containing protein [Marinilongibacter aquaticus]
MDWTSIHRISKFTLLIWFLFLGAFSESLAQLAITELVSSDEGQTTKLEFTVGNNYTVEQLDDSGAWQNIGQSSNGTFTANGLDPAKAYCYRVTGIDASSGIPLNPSNTVCEIQIDAQLINTQTTEISWTLPQSPGIAQLGMSRAKLIRDEKNCTSCSRTLPVNLKVDPSPYTDANLDCTVEYIYNAELYYPLVGTGVRIVSEDVEVNPSSLAGLSIPEGVLLASLSPTDASMAELLVLGGPLDGSSLYRFLKKGPNESNYSQIGSDSPSTSTTDPITSPESGSYCYKFQYQDNCGQFTQASEPSCTVYLKGNVNELTWNAWQLQPSPLVIGNQSYQVLLFDPTSSSFQPILPNGLTNNLFFSLQDIVANATEAVLKFKIQTEQDILDPSGSGYSSPHRAYSNVFELTIPPTVWVPTALNPKSSIAANQSLVIHSKFLQSGNIQIYDRWGTLIFRGDILDQSKAWNGTAWNKGGELPAGHYSFRLVGQDEAGQTFSQKGSVFLIK